MVGSCEIKCKIFIFGAEIFGYSCYIGDGIIDTININMSQMKRFWLEEIRCNKCKWELGKCLQCISLVVGLYDSQEEAASAVQYAVANQEVAEGLMRVGFIVHKALAPTSKAKARKAKDEYCWSYDADGNALAHASADWDRIFYGRPPEECPFKEGDKVIDYFGGCLQMGFIAGTPPTPEWVKAYDERKSFPEFHLDGSDDCFLVDYDDKQYDHNHPPVTRVFPCKIV